VEIGMRVLNALVQQGEPVALGVVAQASGLSNSQAHRYLRSLIVAELAQQNSVTGRYDVGAGVLRLGLAALSRVEPFKVADAAISAFSERRSRTVQVAALGPLGPTIVRWNMGRPPVMTSFGVGSVLSVLYSATGRVFLAFVPESEIDHIVQEELRRSKGMKRSDVENIRREVRAQGYARVDGLLVPGLRAIAYPIRDLQGRAVLTATLVDSAVTVSADDATVCNDLRATCAAISAQLGWHNEDRI
jgi:DNA-binding IclR family transcriptional regulator